MVTTVILSDTYGISCLVAAFIPRWTLNTTAKHVTCTTPVPIRASNAAWIRNKKKPMKQQLGVNAIIWRNWNFKRLCHSCLMQLKLVMSSELYSHGICWTSYRAFSVQGFFFVTTWHELRIKRNPLANFIIFSVRLWYGNVVVLYTCLWCRS